MARNPLCSGETTTTVCGVNYELLAVMLLKEPRGQILVAVNSIQLRTKLSEIVDKCVSYPQLSTEQYLL